MNKNPTLTSSLYNNTYAAHNIERIELPGNTVLKRIKPRWKRFKGIVKTFNELYSYQRYRQGNLKIVAFWYSLKICYWIIRY